MRSPRGHLVVTAVGAALGTVLLLYAVDRVGVAALVDGIRRVGWGIVLVIAIGGARFALRAQCWRLCLPRGVRLTFPHAFTAYVAGDAVGNVTPLGLLASEPTKVLLSRRRMATMDSVASLTLENLLYTMSVLAMLAFGLLLLLGTVAPSGPLRVIAVSALVAVTAVTATAAMMLRAPVASQAPRPGWRARVVRVRTEVGRFAATNPRRVAGVLTLQVLFHVLAVAETFLILGWLMTSAPPTLLQAILFETINRLTIVVFKFVPFRIGVDEAAAGAVAPLFAATAAAGVALAIVRKARLLFWSGIGLAFLASHRLTKHPTEAGRES
jgi:hypothetical protein